MQNAWAQNMYDDCLRHLNLDLPGLHLNWDSRLDSHHSCLHDHIWFSYTGHQAWRTETAIRCTIWVQAWVHCAQLLCLKTSVNLKLRSQARNSEEKSFLTCHSGSARAKWSKLDCWLTPLNTVKLSLSHGQAVRVEFRLSESAWAHTRFHWNQTAMLSTYCDTACFPRVWSMDLQQLYWCFVAQILTFYPPTCLSHLAVQAIIYILAESQRAGNVSRPHACADAYQLLSAISCCRQASFPKGMTQVLELQRPATLPLS